MTPLYNNLFFNMLQNAPLFCLCCLSEKKLLGTYIDSIQEDILLHVKWHQLLYKSFSITVKYYRLRIMKYFIKH